MNKMGKYFRIIIVLFFFVGVCLIYPKNSFAVSFTLVPPQGTLVRGQNVQFTINIDSQGASITTIQTGITYDTQYLEYVSVAAGNAMNAVTADTSTAGRALLTGTNNAGFTGTGVFATITFKLIAQSAGETELCTLWTPTPTPSPSPTGVVPTAGPTSTPVPVCGTVCTNNNQCPADMPCFIVSGQSSGFCRRPACPEQNNCICPAPTALPYTGNDAPKNTGFILGFGLLLLAGSAYFFSHRLKYKKK